MNMIPKTALRVALELALEEGKSLEEFKDDLEFLMLPTARNINHDVLALTLWAKEEPEAAAELWADICLNPGGDCTIGLPFLSINAVMRAQVASLEEGAVVSAETIRAIRKAIFGEAAPASPAARVKAGRVAA